MAYNVSMSYASCKVICQMNATFLLIVWRLPLAIFMQLAPKVKYGLNHIYGGYYIHIEVHLVTNMQLQRNFIWNYNMAFNFLIPYIFMD
jgi:hypothetical protein